MVFNSINGRVALEPGDKIKCRNVGDARQLTEILNYREIKWTAHFDLSKNCHVITILADEEAAEQ